MDPYKEELQAIWDEELIASWENFGKCMHLVYRFTERASPILKKLGDIRRMVAWISTLELKRCPWTTSAYPWNIQVRAFVAEHSPGLTNALYNENIDNKDILKCIGNYWWITKGIKDRKREKETKDELERKRTTRFISLRAGDKNHDWKTVK
jgi:hypothetical protein